MLLITTAQAARCCAGPEMMPSVITPVHHQEASSARLAGPETIARNVSTIIYYLSIKIRSQIASMVPIRDHTHIVIVSA